MVSELELGGVLEPGTRLVRPWQMCQHLQPGAQQDWYPFPEPRMLIPIHPGNKSRFTVDSPQCIVPVHKKLHFFMSLAMSYPDLHFELQTLCFSLSQPWKALKCFCSCN